MAVTPFKYTTEVFCLTYNEELILPAFIDHYRQHFGATFTFFDNHSTDRTKEIILDDGCKYLTYDSNGKLSDSMYLYIKNDVLGKAWKQSKAFWVIVCDADEFLEIDFPIDSTDTLIQSRGYDILGGLDSRIGVPNKLFNKTLMFQPRQIQDINFLPGAHYCNPVGNLKLSHNFAKLLHRKYVSEEQLFAKHSEYEKRLSDQNKELGFGKEYIGVTKEGIAAKFAQLRAEAVNVDDYHTKNFPHG